MVSKAQTSRWPDGKPATLIRGIPSTPGIKLFLEKFYDLREAQVKDLSAMKLREFRTRRGRSTEMGQDGIGAALTGSLEPARLWPWKFLSR